MTDRLLRDDRRPIEDAGSWGLRVGADRPLRLSAGYRHAPRLQVCLRSDGPER